MIKRCHGQHDCGTTNASVTTTSSDTANASKDVDSSNVASHISREASNLKKFFEIMKEYRNNVCRTTITSLGQTTTTTTTTKVVETLD